ncbi:Polyketide cyclase / dehydrase and lipid transport [Corynebacterium kutscheri]|uniref:SRPBCC family protein n=1 Tax=Corynebacterium kutscheri TaxID=35755 RepID=UPI000F6E299E|nr:SRPBCC family protein [Corynebacterium kutscheri]VEH82405.1 Polyketide cyclase / dehydrase and lipid transport [Corynebacterium kutscheri]
MGKLTVVWEEELPYSAQQFWHVVTDLTNWQWRSDLSLCEVIDERKFIEFPKKGKPIRFYTTRFEEPHIWEFQVDSPILTGTWQGIFSPKENGGCLVKFIENVHIRNKLIPNWMAKRFITAHQAQYFRDLRVELKSRYS